MGRYAPIARLDAGGMADVFLTLAHGHMGVSKLAVVKRLRNPSDEMQIQMFLDEARLSARFAHANIVHTYEVGESRGAYFIAMEYLEGQPLSNLLKVLTERGQGLPEPFVVFIATEVLKGLHYAHQFCDFDGTPLNVVHRDVSPHNLFLTYAGEVKLLDFGIAKATLNSTRTEEGILKGTVRYMAPELALQADFDRRADIFAFGVVLWEMLAQRPLFSGTTVSILTRLASEDIPSVRSVRASVSPALDAIVFKATRRDRADRYATAEQMRLDLAAYARGRDDGASEIELESLMNDTFAQTRDEVRSRLKAYISAVSSEPQASVPAGFSATGNLPTLPLAMAGTVSELAPPKGHGMRRVLALVLAVVLPVVGVGVVVALRLVPDGREQKPAAATLAPPEIPVASAPAPAPPPPAETVPVGLANIPSAMASSSSPPLEQHPSSPAHRAPPRASATTERSASPPLRVRIIDEVNPEGKANAP
jgi:serine/threonine protein kinase